MSKLVHSFSDTTLNSISILSYNVLLPNSLDGWWIYKYYNHKKTSIDKTTWEFRSELLKQRIRLINADIVCLQEVSADSFENDFSFMTDLGYNSVLHTKSRFRNATFWKVNKLNLVSHFCKDRSLLTSFALEKNPLDSIPTFYVANCHLNAGPAPERRLRQVHEALETIRKDINKATKNPDDIRGLFLCGDFNSDDEHSAVKMLLKDGIVEKDFVEPNYPAIKITSKAKNQKLGTFTDIYQSLDLSNYSNLQLFNGKIPTLILEPLIEKFKDSDGSYSQLFESALENMFFKFSSISADRVPIMSSSAVTEWLLLVNKELGRGSEFRLAQKIMEEKKRDFLDLEDFKTIYRAELEEGKYWGVEHDLSIGNGYENINYGEHHPFEGTFDYLFYQMDKMTCVEVLDPLTPEERVRLYDNRDFIPNEWYPSDHLPVGGVFVMN